MDGAIAAGICYDCLLLMIMVYILFLLLGLLKYVF